MRTHKLLEGAAVVASAMLFLAACRNETKTTESEVTTSQESTVSAGTTETTGNDTAATSTMAPADQVFAKNAAAGGLAEIELSQLAVRKAASADVKAFAERMVADHTAVAQELAQIMSAKGMTSPAIDAEHQTMREKLNGLSGAAFDKEYMAGMMKDHDATVADYRGESVAGGDRELRAFASKTLPKLEEHAKKAHVLAGKMGLH